MLSRILLVGAAMCAAACTKTTSRALPRPSPQAPAAAPSAKAQPLMQATAVIRDLSGARVGAATFADTYTGVLVTGNLTGIGLGAHGIHIHEIGKCEVPFMSAGGHFNPMGMEHAGPADEKHHAGDLGNIEVQTGGTGDLTITSKMLTVQSGPNSVVGRSVIFHEKADDLKTQPTGNAGGRLGCGVIK